MIRNISFCINDLIPIGIYGVPRDTFGVYAIIFDTELGQKIYIGSTSESFYGRFRRHLGLLKRGIHFNRRMQNLWFKYKEFKFVILQSCLSKEEVISKEQEFINRIDQDRLINLGPALPSPTLGMKHSLEAREKISWAAKERYKSPDERKRISRLGKKHSLETREKMSLSRKGRPGRPQSPETRAKISAANKGRKFGPPSLETREKISLSQKGKSISPEHRAMISAANKGKKRGPHSLETREKISKANIGRIMSPKIKEALLQSHLGISHTKETREKMSLSHKGRPGRPQSPETRAKISAANKGRKFGPHSLEIREKEKLAKENV